MVFMWSATLVNFYLICFLLKYFPGNIFINGFGYALSECIATVISGFLYDRVGVKMGFVISFLIGGLGGVAILIYEVNTGFFGKDVEDLESFMVFAILVIVAKFGISSALNICFICNSDVFPVLFSATGCGICQFFGRTLTLLSPMIAEIQNLTPMLIYTILCFISMIGAFFLDSKQENQRTS